MTVIPEQTGFSEGMMFRDTGNKGYTIIVMGFEVAGLFVVQGSEDVRMQVTISPFTGT